MPVKKATTSAKTERATPKKSAPAKKNPSAKKQEIQLPTNKPTNNKKILVVDNDKILVRVLSMKFEHEGFMVTVRHDGSEALESMRAEKFNAIVLDLLMPVKNGYDVLEERPKTLNADTPVFVMSGVTSPDAAAKVESLGATRFFLKFRSPLKDIIQQISEAVMKA